MADLILHLVRHPPPLIAPGTCYGRLDVPARGVDAAADRLRGLLPAAPLWSSPLTRCRELAARLHLAPRFDDRLMEMDFGDWEGLSWDAIGAAALDAWAADVAGFAPPGGESAEALQARALEFVGGLPDREAVVVTHGGVIRTLLAHWQGMAPADWSQLAVDYGSLTTVTVRAGKATVVRLNG